MKPSAILFACALALMGLAAVPTAAAQNQPEALPVPGSGTLTVPGVGQVDYNPTDGWQFCKRVNGSNLCIIVLESECQLGASYGFGGCLVR